MDNVSEEITLSDGSKVVLRTFSKQDIDDVQQFYLSLPDEEKDLMHIDVRDRDSILHRQAELEELQADRLILMDDDSGLIVGEAVLEPMRYGWMRKTGEIRIRLLPRYDNPELAHFISKEVFLLAARRGLNSLITKVIDGDQHLIDIFKKLNFKHQATLKQHAVDIKGNVFDVHLLTFSLHRMWQSIEESLRTGDFANREDL